MKSDRKHRGNNVAADFKAPQCQRQMLRARPNSICFLYDSMPAGIKLDFDSQFVFWSDSRLAKRPDLLSSNESHTETFIPCFVSKDQCWKHAGFLFIAGSNCLCRWLIWPTSPAHQLIIMMIIISYTETLLYPSCRLCSAKDCEWKDASLYDWKWALFL